ncbi:exo-alpha-sialidase [Dactylosporangium sp. CS-047395]|uniref:exo-alpha-sialidase n=1 Tax=Dactylosporangium sp. CS-047395 TaxID=3239936 RepID=UPI003D8C7E63
MPRSGFIGGAAAGFALALLAVGVAANPSTVTVTRAGGSLPLTGDELVSGDGGAPDQFAAGSGSHWNVLNWGPGSLAAVPASYGLDSVDGTGRTVKRLFVSSQANPDVGTAASVVNMSTSDDSGLSFPTTRRNYPTTALNMVRRPDGSLLGIDFIPEWADTAHTRVNLIVHTSEDGAKWTTRKAPLTMPPGMPLGPVSNGLRVHRAPLVLQDGTILQPAYTVLAGTSRQISIVLQSTDNGKSWTFRSQIRSENTPGTNEVGWSRTSDGRLTAALRTTDNPARLVQSFSGDDGRTWSEPVPLRGPDGVQVVGIYPDLVLQPNGTLLLSTGRPDVRVLTSFDGTGTKWDTQQTVFANYPSTGNNGRYDGTSGNTSLESVSASRSVLFYDQCAVWGCGAYDEQMGISAQYVAAVTPGTGRIDVMSKLLDGSATLSGTFRKSRFPETRPQGAFDGSSSPSAAAVLSKDMVLKLDRAYAVNRIGLMLGNGQPQTATVQLSADGEHWSAPVVNAAGRRDWALRYTDFPVQQAQYVKVTGAGTTVTELEVYAAGIDTFENEKPFAVPRGWRDAEHAWVTDVAANVAYGEFGGAHSATALRLWDKWTDDNARITRSFPAAGHTSAAMQWGYADGRTKFTIGLGQGTSGAWSFAIVAGAGATTPQSVQVFDGKAWTSLGSLSAVVPARTYVPVTLDADATTATLTVNGQRFTTTTRSGAATTFDALTLTTGDPAEYGGAYYVDDVSIS